MTTTPRFPKPKRGGRWPAGAQALVIVTLEETNGNVPDALDLLAKRARWPGGLPSRTTIITWARRAGIDLVTVDPANVARTDDGRAARFARLERHRETLSDLLGSRILPSTADLIVDRLEEAKAVELRVKEARERLDEALLMQRAAADDDQASRQAARREVVLARLLLEAETDARIPFRDLIRLTAVGVKTHLELEGLAEPDDEDTNPIIVELRIPRPAPIDAQATIVQQHELPERT